MKKLIHMLVLAVPALILLTLAFGFVLAPNAPDKTHILAKYAEPSPEFPLGTDAMGRCELSRLLQGGRTTLGIVLLGAAIVFTLGVFLGFLFA